MLSTQSDTLFLSEHLGSFAFRVRKSAKLHSLVNDIN